MEKHQIKLIDNTYTQEEAKELLMALINDKIKFLGHRIFSLRERFGTNTTHLEQRISELNEEKNHLLLKLNSIENSNHMVDIDCHVHLKINVCEDVVV